LAAARTSMTSMTTAEASVLKLKRGEDRRIRAGHPWVFSNEIDTAATPLSKVSPGAVVRIHSDRDQFLGHAYWGAIRSIRWIARSSCTG
jgi:23S rRNA (cytosine1962-C5)-methyltransferase